MTDLSTRFDAAMERSRKLTTRPDNRTLLSLYAFYKQGTLGDAPAKRPAITDLVARAKHEAWNAKKGMAPSDAMAQYIALIDSLE